MTPDDFNPFDLSAGKPEDKEDKEKKDAPHVKPPKATVRRVGIGPLLHSRFSRSIVLIGTLIICAAAGYSAELWWLSRAK